MTRIAILSTCLFVALTTAGCSRWPDPWIFTPSRTLTTTPGTRGLEYEDVLFPSLDRTALRGWWIPGGGDRPCVILFHDRQGNIGDRLDIVRRLHDRLGVGVFVFDYRGYGASGGSPSDRGLEEDGVAARNQVRRAGWATRGEILYGRGLGAAVALAAAVATPGDALVLEGAFTTLSEAARVKHPVLYRLFADRLRGRFENVALIGALSTPVMFLHGDRDGRVPIGMAWKLFDACTARKRFHTLNGAGHDDAPFMGGDTYWSAWEAFLADLGYGPPRAGFGPEATTGIYRGSQPPPAPTSDNDEDTRSPR